MISPNGGDYTITLRVLAKPDCALYLGVGDNVAHKVELTDSDVWQEVVLPVHLEPGVNVIRLCYDRGPMPDVDYADIRPSEG